MIRVAKGPDIGFLSENYRHITVERLMKKVDAGHIYIHLENELPQGLLCYSRLWSLIPFMDMLFVVEGRRNKGIARSLVSKWELDMFHAGADLVLTSTQADEQAQHFYRKLGYRDCGALFLPIQLPAELFLYKMNPKAHGP